MCCSNGNISLPTLSAPLEPLKSFYAGDTPQSRHLLDNIRKYNSCFQMTSFGTDKEVTEHGYMPTFKVQSQVYRTPSVASSRCLRKKPSFCRSTASPMRKCR